MNEPGVILVCTVGGSPQPLASALRELRPERVLFVVSDGKGSGSSRGQVDDLEIVYDRNVGVRGPGLRHAEGCPDQVWTLPVPADDPDRTYALCLNALADLRRRYPDRRLLADYTGGTKSMTGGLLMAAFATAGVEVQFMVGERPDLSQVASGTETPRVMSADLIQAERDFEAARQAVAGFDYAAANRIILAIQKQIASTRIAPPSKFRQRLDFAKRWTGLMAQWDAFHHREAARAAFNAHESGDAVGEALVASGHYHFLQTAASAAGAPCWELCADLWLNAQRRAVRGRWDDALARLYRLVEAAAQARLKERYGIDSACVALDALPSAMRSTAHKRTGWKGETFATLAQNDAYMFLGHRDPSDPLVCAYAPTWRPGNDLRGPQWLSARNKSILAHGFNTIREKTWLQGSEWVEKNLRPFWRDIEPPQLPTRLDC